MEFLKKGLCTLLSKKNSQHGEDSLNIRTLVLSTGSKQKKICVAIFEQPTKVDSPKYVYARIHFSFFSLQEKEIMNGKKIVHIFGSQLFFLLMVSKKNNYFYFDQKTF